MSKAALKSARDSLKAKSYQEALDLAKSVLDDEPTNYNALIFAGAAADGLSIHALSEQYYDQAIAVDAASPLAWQGLKKLYENMKTPPPPAKRLRVFEELLKHFGEDVAKQLDLMLPYASLLLDTQQYEAAITMWQRCAVLAQQISPVDEGALKQAYTGIVSAFSTLPILTNAEAQLSLLATAADSLCLHLDKDNAQKHRELQLKTLLNFSLHGTASVNDKLLQMCTATLDQFSDSVIALETLCTLHCIDFNLVPEQLLHNCLQKLVAVKPDAPISLVVAREAAGDLSSMKQACKSASARFPLGWTMLVDSLLLRHEVDDALAVTTEAIAALRANEAAAKPSSEIAIKSIWLPPYLVAMSCDCMALLPKYSSQAVEKAYLKVHDSSPNSPAAARAQLGLARLHSDGLCREWDSVLRDAPSEAANPLGLAALPHIQNAIVTSTALSLDSLTAVAMSLRGFINSYIPVKHNDALADLHAFKTIPLKQAPSECLFRLGTAMLHMCLVDQSTAGAEALVVVECRDSLLQAAKQRPDSANVFVALGDFYARRGDVGRSVKCRTRALALNPEHSIGTTLLAQYVSSGDEAGALRLLESITQAAGHGKARSAWLALGDRQRRAGDTLHAVISYQSALRAQSDDVATWRRLADCYLSEGKQAAALKAYRHAAVLEPHHMGTVYAIARTLQLMSFYADAETEYRHVLTSQPDHVAAMIGLASVLYARAAQYKAQGSVARAAGCLIEGLVLIHHAGQRFPNGVSIWKLGGDICSSSFNISSYVLNEMIHADKANSKAVIGSQVDSKRTLLELGVKLYEKAMSLNAQNASLWHDLAVLKYRLAGEIRAEGAGSAAQESEETLRQALTTVRVAVKLSPRDPVLFCTAGTIAAAIKNARFAQHCFLHALELDQNNVVAWTGLGTLFLQHGYVQLSHIAFQRAQSADPSHAACWTGQGLVAEAIGHSDALGLHRHAADLDAHPEADFRFASETLTAILQHQWPEKDDVHMARALEAIERCCQRQPYDVEAHTIYALLLERVGLHRVALSHAESAVALLESKTFYPTSASTPYDQRLTHARANYARLLAVNDLIPKALSVFQQCSNSGDLAAITGHARVLVQAKQYGDAYNLYGSLLAAEQQQSSPRPQRISELLVAIGICAHLAGDAALAKQYLLQSAQLSPGYSRPLFVLCALSMHINDFGVAGSALGDWLRAPPSATDREQTDRDAAILFAILFLAQNQVVSATTYVMKFVHSYPYRASAWRMLSAFLISRRPDRMAMAQQCALNAESMRLSSPKLDAQAPSELLVSPPSETLLAILSLSRSANPMVCRQASRSVFANPTSASAWQTLLAAAQLPRNAQSALLTHTLAANAAHVSQDSLRGATWCQAVSAEATVRLAESMPADASFVSAASQVINTAIQAGNVSNSQQAFYAWLHGRLALALGQFEVGLNSLKQAVSVDVRFRNAWKTLSEWYISQNRLSAAQICFHALTILAPAPLGLSALLHSNLVSVRSGMKANLDALSETLRKNSTKPVAALAVHGLLAVACGEPRGARKSIADLQSQTQMQEQPDLLFAIAVYLAIVTGLNKDATVSREHLDRALSVVKSESGPRSLQDALLELREKL